MRSLFIKNTFWVTLFTIICRFFGYVRERMVAYYLGVGAITDALSIAIKVPSFFRRVLAEGAFSSSFLPVFTRASSSQKTSLLLTVVFFMVSLLLPLTFFFMFWTEPIVTFVFPKLLSKPLVFEHVVYFAKVLFPFLLFIHLSSVFSCVLQSNGSFKLTAFAPLTANVFIIAFGSFAIEKSFLEPGPAIAFAASLSGLVQMLVLLFPAIKTLPKGPSKKPSISKPFKEFLINFFPGVLGNAGTQLYILVEVSFITFLSVGGATYLAYADRVVQLVVSSVGTSIMTTLLPLVVVAVEKKNLKERSFLLNTSLHIALLLSTPAVLGCLFFGKKIVSLLYQYGAFKESSVAPTTEALWGFVVGLPSFLVVKVISSVFFAYKDTKTPAKAVLASLVFCLCSSFLLVKPLEHLGLALSASLSSYCNLCFLLVCGIKKGFLQKTDFSETKPLRIILANALFFLFLFFIKTHLLAIVCCCSHKALQTVVLLSLTGGLYTLCCGLSGLWPVWRNMVKRK